MSINAFPQHASTHKRNFSDEYLLPSHYPFKSKIDEDIEKLQGTHDFIIIDDEDLIEARYMSNNSLSYGDAQSLLFMKACKDYAGGQCWDEVLQEPTFEIETALYSQKKGKTFYFFKVDTTNTLG